ncbi:hypothetical protein L6654_43000 [Bradyrhizobium sp. WYCCWR 13023]|uniref:Uncharacterized protein n=1 Tax=Bradyrhizobium zhengyangense TaxID=2911009 RepID=A0A9X1RKU2_9BRAD|nr:hypothetical protein [Bradyrhizobium zhengyangense]
MAIKLPFLDDATEPNAIFDALLEPQQFHFREIALRRPAEAGADSR